MTNPSAKNPDADLALQFQSLLEIERQLEASNTPDDDPLFAQHDEALAKLRALPANSAAGIAIKLRTIAHCADQGYLLESGDPLILTALAACEKLAGPSQISRAGA